ncbi:MAG TPA: hypothetical protein VMJ93_11430 [Verrucomicrobiae bacterium]|nr:hypothetical protein [Verrucomicrobiae bacterium]
MGDGESVYKAAVRWLSAHWLRILGLSALVLVPVFWHTRIEAGDLGSHVYNAWLTQLIERGQVAGLKVVWMWQNVLFDFLLAGFGKLAGLHAAEKTAVSIAVLVFFWGAFAFVSALNGRAPWLLVPCLAMFSYGWTFEAGFMNYYLSLGISFFALAILWRAAGWRKFAALGLAPLVMLGHGVGLAWLLGAAAYLAIYQIVRPSWRMPLFVAAVAALAILRFFLFHHYVADPERDPFYWFTGADQLAMSSPWYWTVAVAFLGVSATFIAWDVAQRKQEEAPAAPMAISIHLYCLSLIGAYLLPDGIHFPLYSAALALITPRLTLIAAIMLCAWLGALRPRRLHLAGFGILALVFFAMLYRDTGRFNTMEAKIEELVRALPPGQRVLGTVLPPPHSRFIVQHIVDSACIGHCFSYGNYEPSSGAFRVRVLDTNPYVMEDGESTSEMEDGTYIVQPEDLPAYQVYQCGPRYSNICIRPLAAGERNDEGGFHPGRKRPPGPN